MKRSKESPVEGKLNEIEDAKLIRLIRRAIGINQDTLSSQNHTLSKIPSIKGKRLLSVSEVSWYLGISEKTLYNSLARNAKNPFPVKPIRRGKLLKFDRAEIDQYIDSLLANRKSEVDDARRKGVI